MAGSTKKMKSMDKLDELFKLQKEFQEKYNYQPELSQIAAALTAEGGELWNESGGKWWKKAKLSKAKQVGELVDILHFFLLACLNLGITPSELFEAYVAKLGVNYKRQEGNY